METDGSQPLGATTTTGARPFAERVVASRDRLPERPPPGDYVVVDVAHFSTTVVELLAGGARYVHVPAEPGGELAFRERTPAALVGCETDDYREASHDFRNSPSDVRRLDVAGRPTSLVSTNGAATVDRLRGVEGVETFVGGYANAGAVADHLRGRDRPTTLVACGSMGEPTMDDLLGTALIDRHLRGRPVDADDADRYATLLRASKGDDYGAEVERRRRDLEEYAAAVDAHAVVPRLAGDRLVDAAD